jgi:2-phosphosulfolactate phosphatase
VKTIVVSLAPPHSLRGRVPFPGFVPQGETVAVVIDVLRATTTLTRALANGAREVVPVATPEEGFAARNRRPGSLLCGERGGRKVAGFDLGNSPFEYEPGVVAGRTLVFASTNGSQALLAARARRRVLACFTNLGAALERVAGAAAVEVFCAGKEGGLALEDAACAGALVAGLRAHGFAPANPAAALAERLAPAGAAGVRALVEGVSHARTLIGLGEPYARDVAFCASLDALDRAFEV